MEKIETPTAGTAIWLRDGIKRSGSLTSELMSEALYDAQPIRQGNAYPHQRNYHGYFWMSSTGRHVWHESLLERQCLLWLDFTADLVAASSQPAKFIAVDGDVHYPDLLALDARGIQTMYDVKPSSRINAKARAQFEWTGRVCANVGWDYRVLTELPHQYGVNLNWLGNFRHPGYRSTAEDVLDLLAQLEEGSTIDDAARLLEAESTPTARSRVFHLLWNRTLECDMNSRMSGRTPISIRPTTYSREEFPRAA
jgi:hypothetical protein